MRWPIPANLGPKLQGRIVRSFVRRGKYLLLGVDEGSAIFHLGMSGSLRFVSHPERAEKHDHVDLVFNNGHLLRLHDPRRFGALLWAEGDPYQHKLLAKLGPEPLLRTFNGAYLHASLRNRRLAIKQAIMDSHRVVGIGNIYANEALFMAKIHPQTVAGTLSQKRCDSLVKAIKKVLRRAIKVGGTTLKDFVDGDGQAGYFQIQLKVYGQAGEACPNCQRPLQKIVVGGRSTFFCSSCQHR